MPDEMPAATWLAGKYFKTAELARAFIDEFLRVNYPNEEERAKHRGDWWIVKQDLRVLSKQQAENVVQPQPQKA